LVGFYVTNHALSAKERARPSNVIPITPGPHGTNTSEVIDAIGPEMEQLDAGIEVNMAGQKYVLCVMIYCCIGDMP
ncbi:hypothetical protein K470DRAFT_204217, partial [Piedraia hortae CBS 480.64]